MTGKHEEAWARIASDPAVVDGVGILCAAREALTLDELSTIGGWTSDPQRQAFLHGARELLVETRRADEVPEYRLHDESFRAYLAADTSFLEAKCRELDVHETEADVARAAERSRQTEGASSRRRLMER